MLQALFAALLFGASAPLAKLLLGEIDPVPLSAFLYLGSGITLLAVHSLQRVKGTAYSHEAPIRKPDLPWLGGAVLAGGVVAPIILMYSLQVTPAATASLLLNFETVSTTLIAILVFHESLSRPAWGAVLLVTLASVLLSFQGNGSFGISIGALGVLVATGLWGLDNNLTRNISAKDPLTIVMIKGLVAGSISLLLALLIKSQFPSPRVLLGAMLLGSFSYGLSILLFVRALRSLGAARTSALFGTAPLAGVVLSLAIFHDPPPTLFWIALLLMGIGTALLLREQHEHTHLHKFLFHEHAHKHNDDHHLHDHPVSDYESVAHSHPHEHPDLAHTHQHHEHPDLAHTHQHLPDIHHRHGH
jgi:drug/metabolite transporter (DMT)-like permease